MTDVTNESVEPIESNDQEPVEEDLVPRTKYRETAQDLLKWKQKAREYEGKLREQEQNQLKQQGQYKDLYEGALKELETFKAREQQREQQEYRMTARQALEAKLDGGFVKPEYADLAINYDRLVRSDDGRWDERSLNAEAKRIKTEHAALLKNAPVPSAPATAPQRTAKPSDGKPKSRAELLQELGSEVAQHKTNGGKYKRI